MQRLLIATLVLFVSGGVARAATVADEGGSIRGVVLDGNSSPVAAARIRLAANGSTIETLTGHDGTFAFGEGAGDSGTLTVDADGFAEATREVRAGDVAIVIVLEIAPLAQQVTVTAERTPVRLGESIASVRILGPAEITSAAIQSTDGVLRQVPGFQLFRRNDSRYANPTTQGAALRGVAASAASRAAVLLDGVPADDPFGGWVQWGRFPRVDLDQLEAVRGGGSALYGSQALGGVVNIVSVQPVPTPVVTIEASGGNLATGDVQATAAAGFGAWSGRLAVDVFSTDGYVAVAEDERGPVDSQTGSRHSLVNAQVQRTFGAVGRAFVRAQSYEEDRQNGTPLQNNATTIRALVVGLDVGSSSAGNFVFRGYGGDQGYDQSFSSIAPDRTSETLTRIQRVPAQQLGASGSWVRAVGTFATAVAGFDVRAIRGASDEIGYFGGAATSASGSGGRQLYRGVFGSLLVDLGDRVQLTGGVRADWWSNTRGLAVARLLSSTDGGSVRAFDDRHETAVSPRGGVIVRLSPEVALHASAYRGFRAPTLNELYRGFRVGNVVTLPNADLQAERLTGAEGGVSYDALDGRVSVRATGFWSVVTRPIASVTVAQVPELITRQRDNLGRSRSSGFEIEGVVRVTSRLELRGGYTLLDTRVLDFIDDPSLVGNRVPQVPLHSGSGAVRYEPGGGFALSAQVRAAGEQFDDDQNRLPLGRYAVVDLLVSRHVGRGFEAFCAFENLLDTRYDIGRTPVTTVGAPFSVRGGIRFRLTER